MRNRTVNRGAGDNRLITFVGRINGIRPTSLSLFKRFYAGGGSSNMWCSTGMA
jgi:hypothetical protein